MNFLAVGSFHIPSAFQRCGMSNPTLGLEGVNVKEEKWAHILGSFQADNRVHFSLPAFSGHKQKRANQFVKFYFPIPRAPGFSSG